MNSIIFVGVEPPGHRVHAHSAGTPRSGGSLAGDKGVWVGSSSDTHLVPGRESLTEGDVLRLCHHHTDKWSIPLMGDGPHAPSQICMLIN